MLLVMWYEQVAGSWARGGMWCHVLMLYRQCPIIIRQYVSISFKHLQLACCHDMYLQNFTIVAVTDLPGTLQSFTSNSLLLDSCIMWLASAHVLAKVAFGFDCGYAIVHANLAVLKNGSVALQYCKCESCTEAASYTLICPMDHTNNLCVINNITMNQVESPVVCAANYGQLN